MGIPVRQILEQFNSVELSELMAFDQIEPMLDRRLEFLFAHLCAVLVNCHRTEDQSPASFKDFLLWTETE